MDKLLKELRRRLNNDSIKLTKGIDFTFDEKLKIVHMELKNGTVKNMQEDVAAFEAWALALKANLNDLVDGITLNYYMDNEPKKNTSEWRNFNRFIYRIDAFRKRYSDWFSVLNTQYDWENRILKEGWGDLILNSVGKRNKTYDIIKNNKSQSERDLEIYFTLDGSKKLKRVIKDRFNIELGDIENQYPVGVFNNQVKKDNYIFTGAKSAIDLYSIGKDNSFNIFELKGRKNVKIGILSEIFFYSSLIMDVIDGKFISTTNEFQNINRVNAFFLVQEMHPLLSDKVIDMLNLPNSNITYRKIIY